MKGEHRLKVYSKRLIYDFSVRRKVTVISGDSGTGKSTLVEYIQNANEKFRKGVTLECDVMCKAYSRPFENWDIKFKELGDAIIVLDEDFIHSECSRLAEVISKSNCYFILISRRIPKFLTYSYKEIYKIVNSGKFNRLEPIYSDIEKIVAPDLVITEDSKSGYKFFNIFFKKYGIPCISAKGRDNLENTLKSEMDKFNNILVIADGAAFGSKAKALLSGYTYKNVNFFLPESFEFMILSSNMFCGRIKEILNNLPEYIDTSYTSWEEYFTTLLESITKETPVQYSKSNLKGCYTENCCYRNTDNMCEFGLVGDKQENILGKYRSLLELPDKT